VATPLLARHEAPRLWQWLASGGAAAVVLTGTLLAPVSLVALWLRRYHAARIAGAAQVVALLTGWALAQWPYLIYPDVTIADSAAPRPTLMFIAATLPFGLAVLVPSLWFLFRVFKGRNPAQRRAADGG
jgi:cytochrome d ubiquinol oxidase subunit II